MSWLTILCMQINQVGGALLLLGPDEDGAFAPAAVWPDPSRDVQYLSAIAEKTLKECRGVVLNGDGEGAPNQHDRAYVGYPIEVMGTLHGAVVLDLAPAPEAELQHAVRLLHWASVWLIDQFRRRALEVRDEQLSRMGTAMDLVATALQEPRFKPCAFAIVNELAGRLQCDRVSLGLEKSGSIKVHAISHTADFDARMDLARLIREAMDEVLDQDAVLTFPVRSDGQVALAHAELARALGDTAVLSVPLLDGNDTIGVLTLERTVGEEFGQRTVELCTTLGALLGPIVKLKRETERGALELAGRATYRGAQALVGRRHPGVKLIALLMVAIVAAASLTTGTFRIAAKTVIEGELHRAAVAPFDGYILQSFARAGDIVRGGQVLSQLDDRDFRLEHARLSAEREQLLHRHRNALAGREVSATQVVRAQISQVDAQLALIQEKIARARLVAPFDGIIVSGDLSQLIGTPIEQGKVLFQIAPLDSYRVILQVDESDIAELAVGQTGELTLAGLPKELMEFTVRQITPVTRAQEGRNFFQVEAGLESPSERLRPGMEGVGKVSVGERKVIWIWTRKMVNWIRLAAWKWLP